MLTVIVLNSLVIDRILMQHFQFDHETAMGNDIAKNTNCSGRPFMSIPQARPFGSQFHPPISGWRHRTESRTHLLGLNSFAQMSEARS